MFITSFMRPLVTTRAVNIDTQILIMRVNAKLLIVPTPNIARTIAQISVVIFESRIVMKAFLKLYL